MNLMETLDYPLVVGSVCICEVVSSNKVWSLKLVHLRATCKNLRLETNVSFSRKKKISVRRLKCVQNSAYV